MIDRNSLIYIVDDNKQVILLIRKKLENEGFTNLVSFMTYEDLFDALDKNPRIVILDNYLDGGNADSTVSMNAFEELKKQLPDTKVIIFSGETDPDLIHSYIFHGAYTYIIKNLDALDKLIEAIIQITRT